MYKILREWIKDNAYKAINVKLKDIGIMYDIHNKGKFNPTIANEYTRLLPCVVNKIDVDGEDKYILIANWYAYTYLRYLNLFNADVKCIVIEENREDFFKMLSTLEYSELCYEENIDNILITKEFNSHLPKESKINGMINYYNKNKQLDGPITLNSDNVLTNGFIRYLAAKKLGLKSVTVKKTHKRVITNESTDKTNTEKTL